MLINALPNHIIWRPLSHEKGYQRTPDAPQSLFKILSGFDTRDAKIPLAAAAESGTRHHRHMLLFQ
jgi:hypothetical protein